MKLREMVEKLLEVPSLPREERKMLRFVLDTNGDGELEGMLYDDVETHIRGRFEWFYTPAGELRRPA
jgi:hypothetical protein